MEPSAVEKIALLSLSSVCRRVITACRSGLEKTTRNTLTVAAAIAITTLSVASAPALAATSDADNFFFELRSKSVAVKAGETLKEIARREFGSSAYYRLIAEFNQLNPVTALNAGQVLNLPLFAERQREFATVSFKKGEVTLLRKEEEPRELTTDDKVRLTDVIRTGDNGFVSLAFEVGSVVNIQPNSDLELQQIRCLPGDASCTLIMRATQGEFSSDVNKRENQPTDFQIRTPYASAAVRGTVFDFQANNDGLLVGVTEGMVDVGSSDVESAIDTGFGVVTEQGKAPGDPIELIGPPTFRGVPARFAQGDKISWWEVPDSSNYIVSLASDAGAIEIVQQKRLGQQVFEFESITAGEYYINVRPVDDAGLKGFGTTQKITLVGVDDDSPVFPLNTTREGEDVVIRVTEPGSAIGGYEFQIATDETFNDVISIDVGSSGSAIFKTPESGNAQYYARARALLETNLVSRFGPAVRLN